MNNLPKPSVRSRTLDCVTPTMVTPRRLLDVTPKTSAELKDEGTIVLIVFLLVSTFLYYWPLAS